MSQQTANTIPSTAQQRNRFPALKYGALRACAVALSVHPSLVSRVYSGRATSARVARWLAKPPGRWLALVTLCLALGAQDTVSLIEYVAWSTTQEYALFRSPVEAIGHATEIPHDADTPKIAFDKPVTIGKITIAAHAPTAIRLRGADAPEMAGSRWPEQPDAVPARDALSVLLFDGQKARNIRVTIVGMDKYGRPVADLKVVVNRRPVDAAEWLIENGWAWHDWRNVPTADNLALRQCRAQSVPVGIWKMQNPKPIAPWLWRSGQR